MSLAQRYHAATTYSPAGIAGHPGLDWSRQPIPFRQFPRACPRVALAGLLPFDPGPFTGQPPLDADPGHPLARLSRWIFGTYGVTAVGDAQPRPLLLRAAPSAGGLYPADYRFRPVAVDAERALQIANNDPAAQNNAIETYIADILGGRITGSGEVAWRHPKPGEDAGKPRR